MNDIYGQCSQCGGNLTAGHVCSAFGAGCNKLQIIGPKRTVPQAEYILQLESKLESLQAVVDRLYTALDEAISGTSDEFMDGVVSAIEYAAKHRSK